MSRLFQCDACDTKQPKLHFHGWDEGFPHCDTSLCCACNRCDEDCDYRDDDYEPSDEEIARALWNMGYDWTMYGFADGRPSEEQLEEARSYVRKERAA